MRTNKTKPKRRQAKTQFLDAANAIDCPRRLQRKMWKSLRKAAVCKVNLDGRTRARELMAMAEADSESAVPENETKVTAMATQASQILSEQGTVIMAAVETPKPTQDKLRRLVEQVSSVVKRYDRFLAARVAASK